MKLCKKGVTVIMTLKMEPRGWTLREISGLEWRATDGLLAMRRARKKDGTGFWVGERFRKGTCQGSSDEMNSE